MAELIGPPHAVSDPIEKIFGKGRTEKSEILPLIEIKLLADEPHTRRWTITRTNSDLVI